jgi:hypothetical protein
MTDVITPPSPSQRFRGSLKVIATQPFSLIRRPDALFMKHPS